jgi:hypothetical protein
MSKVNGAWTGLVGWADGGLPCLKPHSGNRLAGCGAKTSGKPLQAPPVLGSAIGAIAGRRQFRRKAAPKKPILHFGTVFRRGAAPGPKPRTTKPAHSDPGRSAFRDPMATRFTPTSYAMCRSNVPITCVRPTSPIFRSRFSLSRSDYRRGEPRGFVMAAVEHDGRLPRGASTPWTHKTACSVSLVLFPDAACAEGRKLSASFGR